VREVIGENVGSENYTYYLPRDAGPRKKVEMPDGFEYLYGSNDILAQPVINYLHTRKVTAEQIQSHKIGYTDLEVVFPFFEDGDIVYWQSRSVIDKKFKFPEGTNKTDFVYGIDNIEPGEPIIMTESIFNALMFDRGVPIGGSSPSPNQKIKLKKRGVSEIIVAFDNDEAGRAGTSQCFKLFRSDFSLCYSMPPDPELDWNDIAQMHGRPAAYESLTKNIKKLTFQESIRLKMK
jgi:DNA primase